MYLFLTVYQLRHQQTSIFVDSNSKFKPKLKSQYYKKITYIILLLVSLKILKLYAIRYQHPQTTI